MQPKQLYMKVFISSLIGGMEPLRKAAKEAIESLGYQPIMAEDFGASPDSAQIACLRGVRDADCVILVCGQSYGYPQASGLSATHEEYHEARERCQVFAFIESNRNREPKQEEFITEVQQWESGHYTNNFTSAETLRDVVTRSMHQWTLTQASGSLDPQEMLVRADALLPEPVRPGSFSQYIQMAIAVCGGPQQSVLRPSQLEDRAFLARLSQMALFGPENIFTLKEGTDDLHQDHALILKQESNSLLVDEQGSVSLRMNMPRLGGMALIEEDIQERIVRALTFISKILQEIDPRERLSHVVVKATIQGADIYNWCSRSEYVPNPTSYTVSLAAGGSKVVQLSPPHRTRSAFRLQVDTIAEDLTTLLRRKFK